MNAASVCINELWGHIANGRKPWCLNIGNELHTGDGPFTWDPFDRPEKVLRWGPQEPTARGLFFMTEVQNSECDLLWLAENAYYVERVRPLPPARLLKKRSVRPSDLTYSPRFGPRRAASWLTTRPSTSRAATRVTRRSSTRPAAARPTCSLDEPAVLPMDRSPSSRRPRPSTSSRTHKICLGRGQRRGANRRQSGALPTSHLKGWREC